MKTPSVQYGLRSVEHNHFDPASGDTGPGSDVKSVPVNAA
jgi:hypothetical protein